MITWLIDGMSRPPDERARPTRGRTPRGDGTLVLANAGSRTRIRPNRPQYGRRRRWLRASSSPRAGTGREHGPVPTRTAAAVRGTRTHKYTPTQRLSRGRRWGDVRSSGPAIRAAFCRRAGSQQKSPERPGTVRVSALPLWSRQRPLLGRHRSRPGAARAGRAWTGRRHQ